MNLVAVRYMFLFIFHKNYILAEYLILQDVERLQHVKQMISALILQSVHKQTHTTKWRKYIYIGFSYFSVGACGNQRGHWVPLSWNYTWKYSGLYQKLL